MENLPAHSPLGASSAERWMNCGGSVALLKRLDLPETDEPEYRARGTAAHAIAAACLTSGSDAWETVGTTVEGVEVDAELADAGQLYLDAVRPLIGRAREIGGTVLVEEKMHRPDLHPQYFGTADLGIHFPDEELLDVTDYKNGAGIVVEVEWNAQMMYYAYGLLAKFPGVRRVRLRIVQPNAFHESGVVREWDLSADALCEWAENELLPAMNRAEMDGLIDAGPWCRFCPAKLVCPLLTSLFGAAAKADTKQIIHISNESLGRSYQYVQAVEFYLKALKEEVLRLRMRGKDVPGTKLVAKKANRVFKEGAETVLKARLGTDVYTTPHLKSPAEVEKISPEAKGLVAEWAFTPQTGVTIALTSDKRAEIKVLEAKDAFKTAIEKQMAEG